MEHVSKFKSRDCFTTVAKIKIDTSVNHLWEVLTESGHLKNFHPYCDYHKKSKWDGIGCKDEARFYSGKLVNREVIAWKDGEYFQIKMNNNDSHRIEVVFEVIEEKREVFFRVTIDTDAYRKTPRPIWYLVAKFVLVPSYKKYFNSICNGLKYYCETGKKVTRNQFGSHKKYSP